MVKLLILIAIAIASIFAFAVNAVSLDDIVNEEWSLYKLQYKKSYLTADEENMRFEIFKDNKYMIAEHNKLFAAGKESYELEINQFSDMLSHELWSPIMNEIDDDLNERFNNEISYNFEPNMMSFIPKNFDWPTEVYFDWRSRGAVTKVKNQGHCDACWAFSVTGAVEGQHFIKTGQLISLSEQNLIDCSKKNRGCGGGYTKNGFEYILNNHGIVSEKAYPFEATVGECRFNKTNVAARITNFKRIRPGNERLLLFYVGLHGPISVGFDASGKFRHYKQGVYSNPNCGKKYTHASLLVGYGVDHKLGDYWIVKNSWGLKWGEAGYFRIARKQNDMCGITQHAYYPEV